MNDSVVHSPPRSITLISCFMQMLHFWIFVFGDFSQLFRPLAFILGWCLKTIFVLVSHVCWRRNGDLRVEFTLTFSLLTKEKCVRGSKLGGLWHLKCFSFWLNWSQENSLGTETLRLPLWQKLYPQMITVHLIPCYKGLELYSALSPTTAMIKTMWRECVIWHKAVCSFGVTLGCMSNSYFLEESEGDVLSSHHSCLWSVEHSGVVNLFLQVPFDWWCFPMKLKDKPHITFKRTVISIICSSVTP